MESDPALSTPEAEPKLQPRIYVACLAAYNNGYLHGEWMRADVEPDSLWDGVAHVLSTSPIPGAEEHAIHDYENFGGIRIHEYASIETVSALARLVAEHGKAFALWYERLNEDDDLDTAAERFQDSYIGEFESERDLASHFAEEFGYDRMVEEAIRELPDALKLYVNFDADQYLHDLTCNGDVYVSDYENGSLFAFWRS